MNCSIHGQKEASGACVYCGKLFCEDCLVKIDNRYYCKEHAAQLLKDDGKTPGSRDYYDHNFGRGQEYGNPLPGGFHQSIHIHGDGMYPSKSRVIALLLCLFFGVAGFHRFYVGKIGTGLLWLFTGGFFGIGWIVDIISLVFGSFRDNNGRLLC